MSLEALVARIIDDGQVDLDEALDFEREVFEDGVIERTEADAAFAINDACTDGNNHPEWERVFVRTVSAYVLEDDVTPGVVDDNEAEYLIENIEGDGVVDGVERALLVNIQAQATSISPILAEKITEWGV